MGAETSFWYLYADPVGTNGKTLDGNTLTSADIVFNIKAPTCYHLDPQLTGQGCNHFPSLVLHEMGHTFALDHPNEFPERNFDSDSDPTNAIPIHCQMPTRGLRPSSRIDQQSVMISSLGQAQPVLSGLTPDDLSSLQFLYPICD